MVSRIQITLRIITSILFAAAAALFYVTAEGNRTTELIALVLLLVAAVNLVLVFVLGRIFDRLKKE